MPKAFRSPHLVPFDGTFEVEKTSTEPPEDAEDKEENRARLAVLIAELDELQRKLYAMDQWSLLLVFQALDAAGKDGTIRSVMTGVDPTGCQVFSFKAPSAEEIDHDFLWRTSRALPERGRIGIFNRSWYEEVLVVRVHSEILAAQRIPDMKPRRVWAERFESIRDHERHLARNGTVIVKFWLHVSSEEQSKRLLARLEEPASNWKFSERDLEERALRPDYLAAYEEALRETSRPWAPWYAIPADKKHYMRRAVAEIVVGTLENLDLHYPRLDASRRKRLKEIKRKLET